MTRKRTNTLPPPEHGITLFAAAICRDIAEGGSGTRYFGSTMSYRSHEAVAISEGLLDAAGKLTALGRAIGDACKEIPAGRAYFYRDDYDRAISAGLAAARAQEV